jgi:hypothetical protein
MGPRAGLDTEVRGKILSPLPGIEPILRGVFVIVNEVRNTSEKNSVGQIF